MRKTFLLALLSLTLLSGTALADSLEGRFGIYGKAGAVVPLADHFISNTSESKPGIATGGGLIFGVNKNIAVDVDVTYAPNFDVDISGSKAYEANFTDVAVGAQYRFSPERCLVPYVGVGADFMKGNLKHVTGNKYNLDWTEGGHANIGVDYFITRGIAFNVDVRGILALKGDIKSGGANVGEWHPTSFVGTVGIRLLLPEHAFW